MLGGAPSPLFCGGLRDLLATGIRSLSLYATLQLLEQAFEERDAHMPFLLDHKWNGLRSNVKFQELLSRVGFPSS
jgi:hypothetical protein